MKACFNFFFICILMLCGCSHSIFQEANDLSSQGRYQASLDKYRQLLETDPANADRALFETGMIHAHPNNQDKDYQQALESFQKVINDYPDSWYRKDSEMMLFYINTVFTKDKTIAAQQRLVYAQQTNVENLQQEIKRSRNEVLALQKKLYELNKKYSALLLRNGSADKILIEKRQRRLTLLADGVVIKTYKIALGADPDGPKERQGDNKTPEGIYFIDTRNRDSEYHLSLHISYPNESDKRRSKELGVDPGGEIMIHGIKNGFSWVGSLQSDIDWTNGCIAVTDEEIEEIARLVPNGTIVEIRP